MRLDKLARQLRAHQKATAKNAGGAVKRLHEEIADLDDRIGKQIAALEQGIEPQLIGKRIEKRRRRKPPKSSSGPSPRPQPTLGPPRTPQRFSRGSLI